MLSWIASLFKRLTYYHDSAQYFIINSPHCLKYLLSGANERIKSYEAMLLGQYINGPININDIHDGLQTYRFFTILFGWTKLTICNQTDPEGILCWKSNH